MKRAAKVISLSVAVFAVASVFSATALAWPNKVDGTVTGQPQCNTHTGEFEGSFSVEWTVTQNVDNGYTMTGTSPSSPHTETYPASKAGKPVSQTFTLTQTKYGTKYEWQPKPGWEWAFPAVGQWVKVAYVKDTDTKDFTGSITLPHLGDCEKAPTEVTTVAPTFTEPTCDSEGTVIPAETEGVNYSQSRNGDVIAVTAVAEKGYVLTEGSVTKWTFNVAKLNCTPPPTHECTYTGAGKDGNVDANGGTNDDCAPLPQPPVVVPPTVVPPVVVPPTPETCVASTKTQKKSVTQRFVRFIRTITWTKTTTVNTDCSKTVKVERTVKKVAIKRAIVKPKPQKPVKLPKPDKPVKAPKTL